MTTKNNFRRDDENEVMREVGDLMPSILTESVYDGFHKFKVSRSKDKDAFPEYTESSRGGMLYDRIAASARSLIDRVQPENPDMQWRITPNKRATDMLLDTRFAFRVKRAKRNRRDLTTGVRTKRNKIIKPDALVCIGQMVLPFPSNQVVVDDSERTWITVSFDLDDVEENIEYVRIGVELKNRFIWQRPLHETTDDVLASLPPKVADMIKEMKGRRLVDRVG